ncbi:hypothetical protein [Amycolatopsis nigrescens]|uniref:hypothetical protein n=1 Tax=Amycolatopsis nigrescens TaxID=381445 RepID=UPI00037C874B|nr:hypothetical protein [Amycolatopsis nigrescens]
MLIDHPELELLATELRRVVDQVAGFFGAGAAHTVDGDLDCDPAQPGRLVSWQYGVRLETSTDAGERLIRSVLPKLERAGWVSVDRSGQEELVLRFSRRGAHLNVHVGRRTGEVAIVGSTKCVPAEGR